MSQQINLLLPELRPRFDWLGLPVVLALAVIGLLLVGGLVSYEKSQVAALEAQDRALKLQITAMQQEVMSLGQLVSGRKGDPALPMLLDALRSGNEERQAVLKALDTGFGGEKSGFAGILEGFSRQTIEGLWLTRFELAGGNVQIEGAVIDPSLLPRFIDKLNTEPVFSGRRFAALDMKAIEADVAPTPAAPAVPPSAVAGTQIKARVPLRHTQFVLRSDLPTNLPSNAGGAR
jgi:hypothetical protein